MEILNLNEWIIKSYDFYVGFYAEHVTEQKSATSINGFHWKVKD